MSRFIHLTPAEVQAIAVEFGDGEYPRADLTQCLREIQDAYRQDAGRRNVTFTKHKEQMRALAACLRRLNGLLSTTDAADNFFANAVVQAELDRGIELWHRRGNRLGFSENGPLMRVLRHIHLGLGLTGPSPASVRQAIRDFQRRGGVQN